MKLSHLSACLVVLACVRPAFSQVTVEQIFRYTPKQKGVEYETPDQSEWDKCQVKVDRDRTGTGWFVLGPSGQLLRQFVDTDKDNVVDQWRYYMHGLEVYRDIDTNANNEPDQFRWFNTAGTRWGVDTNEDGKIDGWKRISAEEVSREAILALANRDPERLQAVTVTAAELKQLGIAQGLADKMLSNVSDLPRKMATILGQTKVIGPQTQWVRFDSSMLMPNLVPSESGKAERDVLVYENVMAIIETAGNTGFVQLGEIIQVGDVWKLTRLPEPIEGNTMQVTEGGVLLQPSVPGVSFGPEQQGLSEEVQKLVEQLRDLDAQMPGPNDSEEAMARFNVSRAKILGQLAQAAQSDEERDQWRMQMIDTIGQATQMGAYPNGLEELKRIEKSATGEMLPYVTYRRMLAEYGLRMRESTDETIADTQSWWVSELENYATKYSQAPDAPDAMLQLATAYELNDQTDKAKPWYEQLVKNFRDTAAGERGLGSLRRLGLKGETLSLSEPLLGGGTVSAQQYRGKVLLVIFWTTWCKPCTEDLPQLLHLYQRYHDQGFEVLGVNLDAPGADIQRYLREQRVPWPHIHMEGALESPPARQFGIVSLPTMFLVDKTGKVVDADATVDSLKEQLPKLLE